MKFPMKRILELIRNNHYSQFDISLPILNNLVRLFYGILIIIHAAPQLEYTIKYYYGFLNSESRLWWWPVKWIEVVPDKFLGVFGINLTCFLFFLICMLFPQKRLFRLLSFLIYFQSLPVAFSVINGVFHQQHTTLIASFFLIFLNLEEEGKGDLLKRNRLYLWAIQISFLGSYFLSGLWKLRYFIDFIVDRGWSEIMCLERNLASEYVDGNLMSDTPFHGGVLRFLENYETLHLGKIMWIGVIFIEISPLVSAWFPRLLRFYGLVILVTHISTSLFMNIQFVTAQYAALIFLICHPYYIKKIECKDNF